MKKLMYNNFSQNNRRLHRKHSHRTKRTNQWSNIIHVSIKSSRSQTNRPKTENQVNRQHENFQSNIESKQEFTERSIWRSSIVTCPHHFSVKDEQSDRRDNAQRYHRNSKKTMKYNRLKIYRFAILCVLTSLVLVTIIASAVLLFVKRTIQSTKVTTSITTTGLKIYTKISFSNITPDKYKFILLAPPSTLCSNNTSNGILYNNQFIYSPTDQRYAAGMLNNQFGVYKAYGYVNVTSTALWVASQSSTTVNAYFAVQADRNLVVYATNGTVLWASGTSIGRRSDVNCLQMLDDGNLIFTNSSNSIIWQSNSTVVPG